MISNIKQGVEPVTLDASIKMRLKQIEDLKEQLKQARAFDDEVRLLQHLTDEIRELRELRGCHFVTAR